MLRSMYSGVSGLKAHQVKLDVIGNNIANVNTTGFKSSRVTFKEMLNQTLQGAKAPQDNTGGTNPQQIGLGVGIASIDVDHTQGNPQSTGVATDLAIEGNGFFVINNGVQDLYTRAGSLGLSNGNLINNANGFKIQGWTADENGQVNTNTQVSSIPIPLGQSMPAERTTQVAFGGNLDSRSTNGIYRTTAIDVFDSLGNQHTTYLNMFRNMTTRLTGETAIGANTLSIQQETADPRMANTSIVFADNNAALDVEYDGNDFTVSADWDGPVDDRPTLDEIRQEINRVLEQNDFTGTITLDYLDNPTPADIAALDGVTVDLGFPDFGTTGTVEMFQAKDSLNPQNYDANLNNITITFNDNDATNVNSTYDPSTHTLTVYGDWDDDAGFAPVEADVLDAINVELEQEGFTGEIDWNLGGTFTAGDFAGKSLKMTTTSHWDWGVAAVSGSIEDSITGGGTLMFDSEGRLFSSGSDTTIAFDPVDGAAPTQEINVVFNDPNGPLTQRGSGYTIDGIYADGYESGDLDAFSINSSGVIVGTYSNGINRNLGQIAIANFSNPNGLNKEGDTLFSASENSGIPQVGEPGNGGRGDISGGTLEMSNVDLAQQFTEMITAQRGFQANSKIITTTDQMLQDLVNLKR